MLSAARVGDEHHQGLPAALRKDHLPSWAQRHHVIWPFRRQPSLLFQSLPCLFAWIIPTCPSLLYLDATSSRQPFLTTLAPALQDQVLQLCASLHLTCGSCCQLYGIHLPLRLSVSQSISTIRSETMTPNIRKVLNKYLLSEREDKK